MHAEVCPICQGGGYLDEPHLPGGRRGCHGCGGTPEERGLGWVAVQDSEEEAHQDCELPMWWWSPPSAEEEGVH